MRKFVLLAAAAFTAVATAACSSPSSSTATPPVTPPSASSGTGAAADEGAGSAPSPTPTATATATPKATATTRKPAGQGGQSTTDWKRAAFKTLGCKRGTGLPDKAEGSSVVYADLTGDGRNEAIVKGSCPTTTATNELHVFVYGASNPDKVLLDVGRDHYLRKASVDVHGRTIEVEATALSDDAPRCCPDITITQSWKWAGSGFTTEGPVTEKIS
jgi:hypothetical protein